MHWLICKNWKEDLRVDLPSGLCLGVTTLNALLLETATAAAAAVASPRILSNPPPGLFPPPLPLFSAWRDFTVILKSIGMDAATGTEISIRVVVMANVCVPQVRNLGRTGNNNRRCNNAAIGLACWEHRIGVLQTLRVRMFGLPRRDWLDLAELPWQRTPHLPPPPPQAPPLKDQDPPPKTPMAHVQTPADAANAQTPQQNKDRRRPATDADRKRPEPIIPSYFS